jgi:hypothetical protein
MTPQEKAIEIYNKFYGIPLYIKTIKQCCNIVVDEIIESREDDSSFNDTKWGNGSEYYTPHPMYLNYWLQVKEEINKL